MFISIIQCKTSLFLSGQGQLKKVVVTYTFFIKNFSFFLNIFVQKKKFIKAQNAFFVKGYRNNF